MNLAALAQGIGSTGLFASRVFLPALLTALMLRFGPDFPVLHHLGLLHHLQHGKPTWFTSDPSIIVLAILSAVEIVAQKNAEARQVLHEIDVWGKTIVAALTSFGVITSTDSKFVQDTLQHAGYLDALIPLIVAIGTFRISRTRNAVARAYFDHIDGTPPGEHDKLAGRALGHLRRISSGAVSGPDAAADRRRDRRAFSAAQADGGSGGASENSLRFVWDDDLSVCDGMSFMPDRGR